jgi:hypothetical protein
MGRPLQPLTEAELKTLGFCRPISSCLVHPAAAAASQAGPSGWHCQASPGTEACAGSHAGHSHTRAGCSGADASRARRANASAGCGARRGAGDNAACCQGQPRELLHRQAAGGHDQGREGLAREDRHVPGGGEHDDAALLRTRRHPSSNLPQVRLLRCLQAARGRLRRRRARGSHVAAGHREFRGGRDAQARQGQRRHVAAMEKLVMAQPTILNLGITLEAVPMEVVAEVVAEVEFGVEEGAETVVMVDVQQAYMEDA